MKSQDLINGMFEMLGGILCWLNCYALVRDKQIKGVNWLVIAFFALWGYWNLYYYPYLNQWLSFTGGIFLVLGNSTWVILAIRYRK